MQNDFLDEDFCETCSLLEAVSFIAFGTPERKSSRYYTNNTAKLDEAQKDLIFSIETGNVRAYGTTKHNLNEKIEVIGDIDLNIFGNTWNSTFTTAYADEISRTYINVRINFDDLKKDFQKNETNIDTHKYLHSDYTTPYIEIIFSVINSEGLSKDNQGNVEALKTVIENEMKKRNLPPSNKLTSSIATIIRLPESQKGRAKK